MIVFEVDSPLGRWRGFATERGIAALDLARRAPKPSGACVRDDGHPAARELREYFAGTLTEFTVPVDLSATTPFTRKVLAALRKVPQGRTTSYGEIARRVGRPGAARAVGRAVGSNPVPVVVPCHRVLAADGGLGGFSLGLPLKRALLRHEGISAR
jgi:methylated-DNA-[protein]-cysteine S-methyltransferase